MYRGASCYSSVEVYTPELGEWSEGPTMGEARCAAGVTLSLETDTLYSFGGYSGASSNSGTSAYLASCECLHVGSGGDGRWRPLPPLSGPRAGPNAAAGPDGRLYVLGGGPDGRSELSSMEALDPRTGRWDTGLAPMRCARHYNAAAFGPDGMLYVSGAFRHLGQLDVVERYEPRKDRWDLVEKVGVVIKFSSGCFVF